MNLSNRDLDLAAERAEQERLAGVKRATSQLSKEGTAECISCGDKIEERRREAMPSATRCADCQMHFERDQVGR